MKSFLTCAFVLTACLILLYSCKQSVTGITSEIENQEVNSKLTNLPAVEPPFKSIDVPYKNFEVDAIAGKVIKMTNGTVIKVPKNAFVNEDGDPVEGNVTIKYREFHDAASIIASGIPMTNRGDDSKYMETAGMFEIKGEVEGQKLNLAPEKQLEVSMASYVKGSEFDFFYLDESECKWVTRGSSEPVVNTAKKEAEKALQPLPKKPSEPLKRNKENFVFDLDINYSTFPELKGFKNVVWEYAGSREADDPEKNPWVFKTDWTSVDLLPMKNEDLSKYVLKLRSGDKTFVSYVRPVLSDNNYDVAMAEFQKLNNIYQKAKVAMKAERERLQQEADLLREFRVSDFGIFNWDIWKAPQRIVVKAEFEFDDKFDTDINQVSVFLVSGENRSVIKYTPEDFAKFSFDPKEKNKLIAVLPGNKVAVFGEEDFKKFDTNVIRQMAEDGLPLRFSMKSNGEIISSIDQLKSLIDKIG